MMNHVKRCPRGSFYIQKNDGCNHMTCGNNDCKYQFCWICMNEYNQFHYSSLTSGCYGLSFLNQNSLIIKYPYLRHYRKIFLFVTIYVGAPFLFVLFVIFGLLFFGPIFMIFQYISYIRPLRLFQLKNKNNLLGVFLNLVNFLTFFLTGVYCTSFFYVIFFLLISVSPLIFLCCCIINPIKYFILNRNRRNEDLIVEEQLEEVFPE